MFSVPDALVLIWFLPVVLQIAIPLVILIVCLTRLCLKRITNRQKDQSIDIDFRLLDSAAG